MERVTISMSDDFATELAAFMADHGYENRSEAVRDLARLGLERARSDHASSGECVATLSYVFDHHKRDLARRLVETHHAHHALQVATMHVHLDHETCLEVAVLRGEAAQVRDCAHRVMAERGVTHGHVHVISVASRTEAHSHGGEVGPPHVHLHPRGR